MLTLFNKTLISNKAIIKKMDMLPLFNWMLLNIFFQVIK